MATAKEELASQAYHAGSLVWASPESRKDDTKGHVKGHGLSVKRDNYWLRGVVEVRWLVGVGLGGWLALLLLLPVLLLLLLLLLVVVVGVVIVVVPPQGQLCNVCNVRYQCDVDCVSRSG